ncbi:hypothetical protein [Comamonas sp. JC664]|uniref:hypothetical protein n=1 Tax=Comamonas sp. JC664 TaxID=2801917 RepID=UPI00191E6693|nr:hypothetical protein [Comamonas sp. JC664]MBL0696707.1 hypothetical protein [Comamonas sp. JC664]GHG85650.1 hypothetical protein GCM10012319_42380 [Comamonas sp. KCTC 72670]
MKTASLKTWLLRCALGSLALSAPALAQDEDDPYAYPDEEPRYDAAESYNRPRPKKDEVDDFRRVSEQEHADGEDDFKALSGLDDPNLGVAIEFISGALFLDSPRGRATEPRLGLGVRATWEYGRILDNEALREALWADLRYTFGGTSDGTEFLRGSTNFHYFTIAPAYELKLGKSDFGFFGQVGAGVAYTASTITIDTLETKVSGTKPLFQYGVGFRGRPRITDNLRLSFRVEAMGFRRGYHNDFFLGGSVGTAF